MIVEQLKRILAEYPMSMRLVMTIEQQRLLETTVVELLTKLIGQSPTALVTYYDRRECIIREHVGHDAENRPNAGWLEIDLR